MPFSAAIIKRDFTSVYDTALNLGGASYLRKLTYGGGWSRIRIGALVGVSPNSTSSISDAVLMLGLCSGTDYPGSSYQARSAYGFSFNGSPVPGSTRTLSYTANSGFPYYTTTTGVFYRRTTPVGWQVGGGAGALFLPLAYTGTQKRRFPIYVDITRNLGGGAGVSSIAYGVGDATTAQRDFRPDHFLEGLDQIGTPFVYGSTLTATATGTAIQIGDEFGPLDTLELFWSSNAFPLEIYAVGAVIINPTVNSAGEPYTDAGGGIDFFQQYTPNAQITDFSFGSGFTSAGTVYGYSAGTTFVGIPGTSGGVPMDNFEQYAAGSVTSGVTLNAGTGWNSYGTIY